jgi:MTH538 TIR-like domain (DUF1863)
MSEGATSGNSGKTCRFAAFISYAHADAGVAAKLQSRLERYRLPKHIAESHADGRAALGQIFRDREDLAAAPSLSDAIRAAIAEAEALVVVCSPDAQASRWVGEEIALFQQLHPNRPILAALVRGEPDEAFPAALTKGGTEPLAADLRKGRDGENLGFLKIVAGIAGVPLDALIQRDAQRRIRRVMWITGGALAAVLAMAIMTTLAIQARNEAARQRAEAEGLVEYMLTDLREKLRGVGRLDVMEGVTRRAMEHYRRQGDLNSLPADSLERRARILHAMGEDDEKKGNFSRAQAKFGEARRTTAALLAQSPENADRIFAHAQSEFYVGLIAFRRNDFVTTGRHWRAYRNHAARLSSVEPGSARSFMELGYAEGNLCDLKFKQGTDLVGAAKHCSTAIVFEKKALAVAPRDRKILQDLANRHGALAQLETVRKNYQSAIAMRREESRLLTMILKQDPRNAEQQLRKSWAEIGLAQTLIDAGQPSDALAQMRNHQSDLEAFFKMRSSDRRIGETELRYRLLFAKAQKQLGKDYKTEHHRARQIASNLSSGNAQLRDRTSSLWDSIWP